MTENDDPIEFAHDVREDFDELEAEYDLERRESDRGVLLSSEDLLVELYDVGLNFDTGEVQGTVRVGTPDVQVVMETREIVVSGLGFSLDGAHRDERFRTFEMGGAG